MRTTTPEGDVIDMDTGEVVGRAPEELRPEPGVTYEDDTFLEPSFPAPATPIEADVDRQLDRERKADGDPVSATPPAAQMSPTPKPPAAPTERVTSKYVILFAILGAGDAEESKDMAPTAWRVWLGPPPATGQTPSLEPHVVTANTQKGAKQVAIASDHRLRELAEKELLWIGCVSASRWQPSRPRPRLPEPPPAEFEV